MLVVDTEKLNRYREMIDEDIAELVITSNISRPAAYVAYAKLQLNCNLLMTAGASGWWSGLLLSPPSKGDGTTWRRIVFGSEAERQEAAERLVSRAVFSRVPDNVATALVVRWLDPHADIFFDEHGFAQIYVPQEWRRVADAVPFNHVLSEPDAKLSGESDEQHIERLVMKIIVYRMQSVVLQPFHDICVLDSDSNRNDPAGS